MYCYVLVRFVVFVCIVDVVVEFWVSGIEIVFELCIEDVWMCFC